MKLDTFTSCVLTQAELEATIGDGRVERTSKIRTIVWAGNQLASFLSKQTAGEGIDRHRSDFPPGNSYGSALRLPYGHVGAQITPVARKLSHSARPCSRFPLRRLGSLYRVPACGSGAQSPCPRSARSRSAESSLFRLATPSTAPAHPP